jgi:hypothetical protein
MNAVVAYLSLGAADSKTDPLGPFGGLRAGGVSLRG